MTHTLEEMKKNAREALWEYLDENGITILDTLIEQVYNARTEEVKKIASGMKMRVDGEYHYWAKGYNNALTDLITKISKQDNEKS